MAAEPVRVLVLYSHALMGEGLGRMLAAEPGFVVYAVDVAAPDAVDEALASEPTVIVVEEGGAVDAAEIVRRSHCALVVDVDINTSNAWSLRRESVSTSPDDFLATIREAIGHKAGTADRRSGHERRDPDRNLRPATVAQ